MDDIAIFFHFAGTGRRRHANFRMPNDSVHIDLNPFLMMYKMAPYLAYRGHIIFPERWS
jgi:hypothetical protein